MQRFQSVVRACSWWAASLCFAVGAARAENWQVRGRVFVNVRVHEVGAASVTIFHDDGIAQLDLAALPPELQARFGFNSSDAMRALPPVTADNIVHVTAAPQGAPAVRSRPPALHAPDELAAVAATEEATLCLAQPVQFRDAVDLRPIYQQYGLHFKDQGRRPSCTIFALVSALEYETARRTGTSEPLSEEFLIWAVRELQPGIPLDDGYHFNEVLAALQTYGIPRQTVMPNTFGRKIDEIHPTPAALAEASAHREVVPIWMRADDPLLVERVVDALNRRTPVVIGLRWPHWRTLEGNHLLRDQKPLDGPGHAVTLIGYQCANGAPDSTVFIFRNSYGVNWGLGGCGFVAASYLRQNLIAAFLLTIPSDAIHTASTEN